MGIFDGVLLVSDMDGTLLDENEQVSKENISALEYFKAEGGIFTLASGRNAYNMSKAADFIAPNAPIIADNGSLVMDFKTKKYIKKSLLYDDVLPAVLDIEKAFPESAIEIYTPNQIYFCKKHKKIKRPDYFLRDAIVGIPFTEIERPWNKVVFMQPEDDTTKVREFVETRPYFNDYAIFRSDNWFVEIINREASKGAALSFVKTLLPGIRLTVSAGDNENDLTLIKNADIGYATENASPILKSVADRITVHHSKSALAAIVKDIENIVCQNK